MSWTVEDKIKEIERELRYRRFVYEKLVADGRMKRAVADKQIAILEAIKDDYQTALEHYRAALEKERLL